MTDKKFYRAILKSLVLCSIIYVIGSGFSGGFNLSKWDTGGKTIASLLFLVSFIVGFVIENQNNE